MVARTLPRLARMLDWLAMASFLSKLFGGGSGGDKSAGGKATRGEGVEYQGFIIHAAPEPSGGQWRLVGVIVKQTDAGPLEREFQRADTFSSKDEAESFAVRKGQQIIDEQGDALFANGEPTGRA